MNDLLAQLKQGADQVAILNNLKAAIGRALTPEQQIAVSRVVTGNPKAFEYWLATDAGRAATRAYVDTFVPPGDGEAS